VLEDLAASKEVDERIRHEVLLLRSGWRAERHRRRRCPCRAANRSTRHDSPADSAAARKQLEGMKLKPAVPARVRV
jgi:hypothetical protein